MMIPVFDKLKETYSGKLEVGFVSLVIVMATVSGMMFGMFVS
jgi:hypothetical protein